MTVVPDASVALKWFIDEERREEARALVSGAEPLVAPDLIVPEVLNGAWKAVRRKLVTQSQVAAIPGALLACFSRLYGSAELARRAFEISASLDHPVYDCFYLALAEREDCRLVTADGRLLGVVENTAFAGRVRAL